MMIMIFNLLPCYFDEHLIAADYELEFGCEVKAAALREVDQGISSRITWIIVDGDKYANGRGHGSGRANGNGRGYGTGLGRGLGTSFDDEYGDSYGDSYGHGDGSGHGFGDGIGYATGGSTKNRFI